MGAETSARLAGRCGYCGAVLEAKTNRRRFCDNGGKCRWADWKRREAAKARAPVERALRSLVAKVEEAVQEAREGLAEREGG